MIPKPNKNPHLAASYQPISLLSTLSKLFERVVMWRILIWLNNSNILSKYQAGFRKGKSTHDHIIRIIQNVQAAFNRGQLVGAIFIDIEKAFDKVWHTGLLFKLNLLKIPNYLGKWIANYLSSRTFKVRTNGSLSSPTPIHAGVPQGSVLGPILFNIFVNDIVECAASPHIELALYADDKAAWTAANRKDHIQKRLQDQLNATEKWMSKWRTKLSKEKTMYTLFSKTKKREADTLSLMYQG